MPVYEDKARLKNRWWYEVELGKDYTGKRIRKKERGFKTKKEAERAMTEVQNEFNRKGSYAEPSKMLFADYIQQWFEKKKNSISEQTVTLYESIIRVHIIPALGELPISKITGLHIESFLFKLLADGFAPETVRRIHSVINTSLNAAERLELVTRNVAAKVEKPKVIRKDLLVWEPDYVADFLEKIKGRSRFSIAIFLAVMTGMRQGEILGLRWSDVDLENGTIQIQQTLRHDGKKLMSGAKTAGSIRSIAISQSTIEELKEHRKMILSERVRLGEDYQNNDLVVCSEKGTPAFSTGIMKVWNKLLEETNAPRITFHDLRHTHASLLLKQGVHIKVVSERLGHSSVTITLDRYSHLLPNMQQEAAEGLDNLLFNGTKRHSK